jgi:hypothetical protein
MNRVNLSSYFGWLAHPRQRILTSCVLLVILVDGGGCGKSESTVLPVTSQPVSNSIPTTASTTTVPIATLPPVSVPPVSQSNTNSSNLTQLQLLNRAMMGWEIQNHRRPQTFDDFASTVNFQIPNPPPGQKYALNQRGFIVLVNANQ